MVLIRRNCFKIVFFFFFFYFFGGGGPWGGPPPPPPQGGVISFDCQNPTVFSKTVKTGGSAPDNQHSLKLIICLLLLTCVIFYGKIWRWPQRGIEGQIPRLSYIYINVNHSSNCWKAIHHFERTLIKLQYWTVIALIIIFIMM